MLQASYQQAAKKQRKKTEKMLIESVPGLVVRLGGDVDQPLVDEICAEVWGGEDYVPFLWKIWGYNPENQRYILELDGQPVGLYCLRLGIASPTSSWIQAVRVAPRIRKRGIAGGLIEHAIRASREQGMTVLRYTTAHDNTPMHRLAERFGFQYINTYLIQDFITQAPRPGESTNFTQPSAAQLAELSGLRTVQPEEIEAVWDLISNSPEYLSANQFYCYNWRWMILTRERLAQHLAEKEFYTFDTPQHLQSLAFRVYFTENPEGQTPQPLYRLAGIYGEPAERVRLLQALGQEITALTPPDLKVAYDCQLPQTPATEWALQQAGFVPNDHESQLLLYEKAL